MMIFEKEIKVLQDVWNNTKMNMEPEKNSRNTIYLLEDN
jgi:hypothetical protein